MFWIFGLSKILKLIPSVAFYIFNVATRKFKIKHVTCTVLLLESTGLEDYPKPEPRFQSRMICLQDLALHFYAKTSLLYIGSRIVPTHDGHPA